MSRPLSTILAIAVLLSRRCGSHLFAAGVLRTLGWTFGQLLHLLLTVSLHFMLRTITN